ncbi:hypothetical protein CHS0354_033446 [Potamilus streckersoni]|uniref:Daxx histone-binding domain-containing protein n=1 Tax=Potamilus streckersoni TaxID=2493646 RepID=A0AAE0SGG4_9BIVA|nr:hypothetical protein CHS0354_033446 [Potamilus streckersoni]
MATKFSEFLEFCKDYLKDAKSKDIQKLIHKRYNDCSAAYLTSSGFSDLLCITRAKIESDPQHFFVHLRDFLNELKESKYKRQSCYGKRSLEDTDDSCPSPKVAWSEENSNQSANATCFRDAFKRFLSQRGVTDGSDGHVSSNSQEGNISDGQVSSGQQKGDDFDGQVSSEQQKGDDSDGQMSSGQQKGDDSDGQVSSGQQNDDSDGQVSSGQQNDDSDGQVSSGQQKGYDSDGHMSSDGQDREIVVFDGHVSSDGQEVNFSSGHVSSNSQEGDENLSECDYNSDSQIKASEDSFVSISHSLATQQDKVDTPTILENGASGESHTKVSASENESIKFMGITIAEVKSLTSIDDDDISTYASSSEISNETNASTKSQLEITNDIKCESDKSITISKNDICDGFLYSDEDDKIEETKSPKSLIILESEEEGVYAKVKVSELTVDFLSNKCDSENVSLTQDRSNSNSPFNKNKDQKDRILLGVESCHSESDSDRAGIRKGELHEGFASVKKKVETDDDVSVIAGDSDDRSSHPAYQIDDADESSTSVQGRKKGSRRQIEYLEKLLKKLRDKIESIQSKELSLDDLDDEISDYILEDKYQKKFVKVWEKLCQLKERETTTGRPLERKFVYEGTRYPEINTQIQKFINRNKIFPDYHDIKRLVTKANTFFKLNLRPPAIERLAREAFTDVGNQLQQRRIEDFRMNFGSSLTDQCRNSIDPALLDTELRCKLEQNRSVSKNRLDDVINKYAELQYSKGDNDDDDEEEEEEEGSSQTSSEKGDFEDFNDQDEMDPEQKSPADSNESLSSDELPEFSKFTVSDDKINAEGQLHEKDNLSVKPNLHSISGNSQEISSTKKQLVEEYSASSHVEKIFSAVKEAVKKTVDSERPGTSKAITRDTFSIVINDDDDDGKIPVTPFLSSSRGIKRKKKICLSAAEQKQVGLKRVEPKPVSTDHDIQIESQIKIHSKIRFLEPTVKKQKLDWEMGQEEMDIIQNYSAPDDVIILSDSD